MAEGNKIEFTGIIPSVLLPDPPITPMEKTRLWLGLRR
jgi:hypothetical protein